MRSGLQSERFAFRKGVFHGDPLAPINPIIEYLETQKKQYGYDFAGPKVKITPYADDFNLITGNKRYH